MPIESNFSVIVQLESISSKIKRYIKRLYNIKIANYIKQTATKTNDLNLTILSEYINGDFLFIIFNFEQLTEFDNETIDNEPECSQLKTESEELIEQINQQQTHLRELSIMPENNEDNFYVNPNSKQKDAEPPDKLDKLEIESTSKSCNFRGMMRKNRFDLHPLIPAYNILTEQTKLKHLTLKEYQEKHNRLFDIF